MIGMLLDLVVPAACLGCAAPGRGRDGPLCGACRRDLRFLDPRHVCPRCALPRPCGRGPSRRCPATGAAWEAAWAPVVYAPPAATLVAALKFRGALRAADLMAAQLVAGLPPGLIGPDAVLVPVPTHGVRRRRRGFDQAEVLARAVGTRTGRPVLTCLHREGPAARQLGAGREERLRDGRIALGCRGAAPAEIVLLDDVHTTGATLRAAALAVRAAGARQVTALTWARTL